METERITKEIVREFSIDQYIKCFDVNNEAKKLCCKVYTCTSSYADKSAAIRHILEKHKEIYGLINEIKQKKAEKTSELQHSLEIRVRVNVNNIRDACVELITANALPISIVDQPAFKKLLEPYKIALKRQGVDLVINSRSMKQLVMERAKQVKEKIMSEVKNKVVCLMMDVATRYSRSVLGISISYVIDDKKVIRTIGMHTLKMSHSAENILTMVKQTFSDYKISFRQLFAVTTDCGKDMLKSVALMDSLYQDLKEVADDNGDKTNADSDDEAWSEDENIDESIFDDQYYVDLLTNTAKMIESCDLIHGIACAGHALNLVVRQAIGKCSEMAVILTKCKDLVKKLRTPTLTKMIDDANFNRAKIDVDTRWNSVFAMVYFTFILLKSFYSAVI